MNRMPGMMLPRVKIEKKSILDDLISDTEDTTDNDISDNEETTNVIKIQNMEDDSVQCFKTITDVRNCWKIQYMNLCHCGRYHHTSVNGRHEIIELTNERDKLKKNNTSMRSVIRFFINELIDEFVYQKKFKKKAIKEIEPNDNKRIIDQISEEIFELEMKIEIYKQLFFNDYS